MPVYQFTLSASRPVGRGGGVRGGSAGEPLTADHQRRMVDAAVDAQRPLRCRCLGVAVASATVRVLIAWDDERETQALRRRLCRWLGRAMATEFGGRGWIGGGSSYRRIRNRTQLNHAMDTLPDDASLAWVAGRGIVEAAQPAPAAGQ